MKVVYKNINIKVDDIDEVKGIVKIAVSGLENVDSDGDIIKSGAWKKTISESLTRIRHLKDHNISLLLGYPIEMFETKDHLVAVSAMNTTKQLVKDTISDYMFYAAGGRTIEHSVGFEMVADKFEKNKDTGGYIFKELKLLEYSTLSFLGANMNTPLLDLKEMVLQPHSDARIEQLEQRIKELEHINPKSELNYDKILYYLKFKP